MSWQAAEWAQDQTTGSPYYKAVLLVVANAAQEKAIERGTGRAYQYHLSHATIAKRAECSPDVSQDASMSWSGEGCWFASAGTRTADGPPCHLPERRR